MDYLVQQNILSHLIQNLNATTLRSNRCTKIQFLHLNTVKVRLWRDAGARDEVVKLSIPLLPKHDVAIDEIDVHVISYYLFLSMDISITDYKSFLHQSISFTFIIMIMLSFLLPSFFFRVGVGE